MFKENIAAELVSSVDFSALEAHTAKNNQVYKTTKTQKLSHKANGKRYDITVCINEWPDNSNPAKKAEKALNTTLDEFEKLDASSISPELLAKAATLLAKFQK